jgi:hypothetical protein
MNEDIERHIEALEAIQAEEEKSGISRKLISAKEEHIIPLRKAGWRQRKDENDNWVWFNISAK